MLIEHQRVKQIDFFRKEKNDIFYEIIYEQRKLKRQYLYERGSETYDDIMMIKIGKGKFIGVGECSPFPSFFGWSLDRVLSDLKNWADFILLGDEHHKLYDSSISSPAQSGINLALIDLKCQQMDQAVYDLYNLGGLNDITISHTVEYEQLGVLQTRLTEMTALPILKVKLGSDGLDRERLILVRQCAPNATIIVDVNEGWTFSYLKELMPFLLESNVKMIEQPLKRGEDFSLADYQSPIPIYADESFSNLSDLNVLSKCYDGFNVKLDKVGGLTNALNIIHHCKQMSKGIMLGCLGGTSLLSTAGFIAAQSADFVDLDNHLWLCQDRDPSLGGEDGIIKVPQHWLWGSGRKIHVISS